MNCCRYCLIRLSEMMSSPQKAPEDLGALKPVEPPLKRRAPTLYAIIIFKLAKGLLCLALAVFIYHEADQDMSADLKNFLQEPFVQKVFRTLKVHPESKFFTGLAES